MQQGARMSAGKKTVCNESAGSPRRKAARAGLKRFRRAGPFSSRGAGGKHLLTLCGIVTFRGPA
jgi:hypothetical protein